MTTKTIETVWEVWTYDVWGNETDGWEVNDRRCINRYLELSIPVTVYNAGTNQEFEGAYPTEQQILDVLGGEDNGQGDDLAIYVNDPGTGMPLGELLCVSHNGLSPIL